MKLAAKSPDIAPVALRAFQLNCKQKGRNQDRFLPYVYWEQRDISRLTSPINLLMPKRYICPSIEFIVFKKQMLRTALTDFIGFIYKGNSRF